MSLLIDGYNLLHVTGIVGRAGPACRARAKRCCGSWPRRSNPKSVRDTTIVFDAAEAPPGLPRTVTHEGMTVRYASDYDDADALIEELIAGDHVPRSLHGRLERPPPAAGRRRRRAPFVDSDVWFAEPLGARSANRSRSGGPPSVRARSACRPTRLPTG